MLQFKPLILFTFALIFSVSNLVAQNYNVTNNRTFELLFINQLDTAENFHPSIQPYSTNELNKIISYDSIYNGIKYTGSSKLINRLTNENLIDLGNNNFNISFNPIINTGITLEKNDAFSETLSEAAFGLNLKSSLGKKWSSQFEFLMDNSKYPSFIDANVQAKNISPGYGFSNNNQSIFSQGNITFTADDIFTFQAGYGKHFIGDGYRSLFLSDNANSYPYLKVTTNIWKIKYMSLFTNFQDIRFSNGNYGDYQEKFSTIHYLSYNATKWLNIGFFESIIFEAQESQFYRGFEIGYLNPIIFLRSTEFAQGSADNALLGGSIKMKVKKKNIIYTQILLDEFLLNELKSGEGWWGNKFGIQAGLKMYDFLTIKDLKFQLEYNIVRPFTYSYFYESNPNSTLQNYGHFNSPLAHPLGANFKEATVSLSYHKKRWILEGLSTIAKVGFDTSSTSSIGQDIYRPYNTRAQEFGNFTTQGTTTDVINSTLKLSYILNPKSQLILQLGITNRMYKNEFINSSSNLIFIGLKTSITNRYFDI
jgi:hypothetical protein